jgi:pimeloyl-ACP methyl ester carboxylesterase
MQTLRVNGYDMAYLEVGKGPQLVCVHGTLGDFRTWYPVLGPLSKRHRVISLSLRRFFPEHWDGAGHDYLMAQHVSDVIGFIEKLDAGPVDLMGHSRGGHIGFRVAGQRPDLLRRLVLAEPGGELDATLDPGVDASGPSPRAARAPMAAEKVKSGDIDGALELVVDMIDGDGSWKRLPAVLKQQLRDNAYTLIGQVGENRKPFARSEAESIRTPTLLIGGSDTKGSLAKNWRVLAQHIPGAATALIPDARHWIFDQAPQEFSDAVINFLAA